MLKAVSDTILVKLDYAPKSKGGIHIPETAKQYSGEFCGIVKSIGPNCPFRNDLKEGDRIIFTRHEGWKVIDGDEEYMVLKSRWVLGKWKELYGE